MSLAVVAGSSVWQSRVNTQVAGSIPAQPIMNDEYMNNDSYPLKLEGHEPIAAGEYAGPATMADLLSPRELEIVRLMVSGLNDKAIAQLLFRSIRTIQNHVSSIYVKLELKGNGRRSIVALVKRALREGLITFDEGGD